MQLEKALLAYDIDLRAENKPPKTIEWYRHRLRYLVDWLAHGDIEHVENLEPAHIKSFLLHVRGLGRAIDGRRRLRNGKPSRLSVHRYAQILKTFCG